MSPRRTRKAATESAATSTGAPTDPFERYKRALKWSSALVQGGTVLPLPVPGSDRFAFAEGQAGTRTFRIVDPEAGTVEPLFDLGRLHDTLTRILDVEPPGGGAPFATLTFLDADHVAFAVDGRPVTLDLRTYEAATPFVPPTEAEKARTTPRMVRPGFLASEPGPVEVPSPDGRWLLGVDEPGNLCIRSTADGRVTVLTDDAVDGFEWDVSTAKWSADGFTVLAARVDTRAMARLPVVHWLKPIEEVEWFPYVKAGGAAERTTFHLVDVRSRRVTSVDHGPDEHMLLGLGFTPSGDEALYLAYSRTTDHAAVVAADLRTGATRDVIAETSTFFNWGEIRRQLAVTPDGTRIVWRSERDGWAHLYLYSLDGTQLAQVTQGEFPVLDVVGWDLDGGWVYVTAHPDQARPYDTHLCRVSLDGHTFERLTDEPGQHAGWLTPSGRFLVDQHSHIDRPPAVDLRRADGSFVVRLTEADTSRADELGWRPPREVVVKADDGVTDLHGLLHEPWGLHESERYPIIDAIYGGPQMCQVSRGFAETKGYAGRALSAAGFAVLVVDARGTPERSKAFHDVVHRNFGRHEIPDHAAALRQVAAENPWIDTDRVGIFGGSWGGYMTIRALLTTPETYHVGIATNSVADLEDHMAQPIEGYMGLPQDNPEGYAYASSHRFAPNLRGKLCLIHGTSDVNATFSATMKLVECFVRAGRPHDLVVLPDVDHHPTGTSQEYWLDTIYRYFAEHLRLGE